MNLIKEEDPDVNIIHFNPWKLEHGGASLVDIFFQQMSLSFGKVARGKQKEALVSSIESYGELFSKIEPLSNLLVKSFVTLRRTSKSIEAPYEALYNSLNRELKSLSSPVYIVIDDLDRMDKVDIKEIFRFIRQIADFDNIRYIVGYDSSLVKEMLGTEGNPNSRQYLDKIIDCEFYIPKLQRAEKLTFLLSSIDSYRQKLDINSYNFIESIKILDELNIRRLVKIRSRLSVLLPSLEKRIRLTDVLLMEIIKEVDPELHVELYNGAKLIEFPSYRSLIGDHRYRVNPSRSPRIDEIISHSKDRPLHEVLVFLFGSPGDATVESTSDAITPGPLRISDPGVMEVYWRGLVSERWIRGYYNVITTYQQEKSRGLEDFLGGLDLQSLINLLESTQYRFHQKPRDSEYCKHFISTLLRVIENRRIDIYYQERLELYFLILVNVRTLLSGIDSENERRKIIDYILCKEDLSFSSSSILHYALVGETIHQPYITPLTSSETTIKSFKIRHVDKMEEISNLDKEWALFIALLKAADWCEELRIPYPSLNLTVTSEEVFQVIQTHIVSTEGYMVEEKAVTYNSSLSSVEEGVKQYITELSHLLKLEEDEIIQAIDIFTLKNKNTTIS